MGLESEGGGREGVREVWREGGAEGIEVWMEGTGRAWRGIWMVDG